MTAQPSKSIRSATSAFQTEGLLNECGLDLHGLASCEICDGYPSAQIGMSHLSTYSQAAMDDGRDRVATHRLNGIFNRWYLDPIYGLGYPEDITEHYVEVDDLPNPSPDDIHSKDLEVIALLTDFLRVNYYDRIVTHHEPVEPPDLSSRPQTNMGWKIYPDGFEWAFGYAKRFGLMWVDFEENTRLLKDSAFWYRDEIVRRRSATGGDCE